MALQKDPMHCSKEGYRRQAWGRRGHGGEMDNRMVKAVIHGMADMYVINPWCQW